MRSSFGNASWAQQVSDQIDQLDLALDQLAVSERNFDRFAIMLVDNVVELSLHSFAEHKALENEWYRPLGQVKHDPKVIEGALGQRFDAKARFAKQQGLVTETVCDSLLLLHGFRNTAHHRGLRHEGILHSLAVFYFRVACTVLGALEPNGWSSSSNDRISYRARKYLGDAGVHLRPEVYKKAVARLDEVAESLEADLVRDLSADMERTIDWTDEEIDFLWKDGRHNDGTRDDVVVEVRAWSLAFTDEGIAEARAGGCTGKSPFQVVEWLIANHKWPTKRDPVPSWRARLKKLREETDHHKALKRYCDFMGQTDDLRSEVHDSALSLDREIQSQIDMARGK